MKLWKLRNRNYYSVYRIIKRKLLEFTNSISKKLSYVVHANASPLSPMKKTNKQTNTNILNLLNEITYLLSKVNVNHKFRYPPHCEENKLYVFYLPSTLIPREIERVIFTMPSVFGLSKATQIKIGTWNLEGGGGL